MPKMRKIVNDPVYGFITIPDDLSFRIIEHPWFQRLRRISQLGLTAMVYPGALHTRFHHALGSMHLMGLALDTLKTKDISISPEEQQGAILAILLHDIGHGPYSHALENCIVDGLSHEEISHLFIERLDEQFQGQLHTAIAIFNNTHPGRFLHQLVSGQLDVDRMDYLMRDSFYTGVSEGVINTDRILKMITVANDELGVELKGIYSIEKFIVARRLMYWQVYYHKTVLAAEYMLVSILKRARLLAVAGEKLPSTGAFSFFLGKSVTKEQFRQDPEVLECFARLDDSDILASVKSWVNHSDPVLSTLCSDLVDRRLFRVIISENPPEPLIVEKLKAAIAKKLDLPSGGADYFLITGTISNNAYDPGKDKINIVDKKGGIRDITEISDQLNIGIYSQVIQKHFICYPKWAEQELL